MIKLVDFSKTYGSGKNIVRAVSGVSFTAQSGQVTALLGPNGAGKTTIIRAVCAMHYASGGKVLVGAESRCVDAGEDPVAVRMLTGYVPEQPALYEDFTVIEFLSTCAEQHLLSGIEKNRAIDRVISDCSLQSVAGNRIDSLSKGFHQRVSFAQSLIHDPPVLVLDEPSSGLDPVQINQVRRLIRKLSATKTVLLSTHLMQEVDALCSTVLILSEGKLLASGTAESIAEEHKCRSLEEAFLKITGGQEEL